MIKSKTNWIPIIIGAVVGLVLGGAVDFLSSSFPTWVFIGFTIGTSLGIVLSTRTARQG